MLRPRIVMCECRFNQEMLLCFLCFYLLFRVTYFEGCGFVKIVLCTILLKANIVDIVRSGDWGTGVALERVWQRNKEKLLWQKLLCNLRKNPGRKRKYDPPGMSIDVVVRGVVDTGYSPSGISSSLLTSRNSFGEDGDEMIDDESLYINQTAAHKNT